MWGWLRAIISGLFSALLEFIWKKKQEPSTIEDEKVPDNIKRDWNDYVSDQLRDKDDSPK